MEVVCRALVASLLACLLDVEGDIKVSGIACYEDAISTVCNISTSSAI